jgi:predicted amidohydrolase
MRDPARSQTVRFFSRKMKTGVYQFAPEFGNVPANLDKIEKALLAVEAELVVLPELCTTGYQFASADEVRSLAERIPEGETVRRLAVLCRRKGFYIAAGMAESTDDAYYNSSVLIGPEGWIGTYRKIHLFHEEKLWFAPGNLGFRVWDVGMVKIGMMVCFDWIFPESARTLALRGAEIICHPANLVLPYCPDAMITRSVENRVYCATANRIGAEERAGKSRLTFIGKSQITGVKGELLFRMDESETGFRIADIDPAIAREKRVTETNDLFGDRRPEAYQI